MPVTTVNAQDTVGLENYPTHDIPFRVAKEACIGAEGCPLGIQVIRGKISNINSVSVRYFLLFSSNFVS